MTLGELVRMDGSVAVRSGGVIASGCNCVEGGGPVVRTAGLEARKNGKWKNG